MSNRKGVILTITLIFIVILAIISGVVIVLMTNQARLAEYQIKRIKVYYTAEAAMTYVLQGFRTGSFPVATGSRWNATTTPSIPIINGFETTVTLGAATGPNNTRPLNVTVDY